MMKKLQRGFTLIELLVVIAIIGILAAVVLGSLNDARDGGQDASIKQSISSARTTAEIIYNENNFSYATVCADASITNLMQAAADNRAETTALNSTFATASLDTTVTCHSNAAGYAIIAPLNAAGANTAWCIDSTGDVGEVASAALVASDITCG